LKKINEFLDEIHKYISTIVLEKNLNREIFGIAMTLFHYYTYYKTFKEFDRLELAVGCVYLSCKIEWWFITIEEAIKIYHKMKIGHGNSNPDFIKFEIEILNFLGFEIDIETPYKHFHLILERNNPALLKNDNFKNVVYSVINDSYRRPLCLYFNPKVIALVALFIASNTMEYDLTVDILLSYDKTVIPEEFVNCLDQVFNLLAIVLKINN
jgi:hypothetical protein